MDYFSINFFPGGNMTFSQLTKITSVLFKRKSIFALLIISVFIFTGCKASSVSNVRSYPALKKAELKNLKAMIYMSPEYTSSYSALKCARPLTDKNELTKECVIRVADAFKSVSYVKSNGDVFNIRSTEDKYFTNNTSGTFTPGSKKLKDLSGFTILNGYGSEVTSDYNAIIVVKKFYLQACRYKVHHSGNTDYTSATSNWRLYIKEGGLFKLAWEGDISFNRGSNGIDSWDIRNAMRVTGKVFAEKID